MSSDVLVLMDVISPIHKLRPRVVIAQFELSMLSIWLLFLLRRFYGFKLILWGHGYDRTRGFHPDTNRMDKLRLRWVDWSDAVILYNENRREEIAKYVANTSKLFVANNTLDTNELLDIKDECDRIGSEKLKRKLGFIAKYNLVYVGRLVEDKQPDYLIDVFQMVIRRLPDVHLHIIGKGPLEDRLACQVDRLGLESKVTLWGEVIDPKAIGEIIYCSDAMVIPGAVGLSIVHAFCYGRPLITQAQEANGPYHGTEIEYLVHGKTGFFAPSGDKDAMSEIIIQFLTDEQRKLEMERHILDVVEQQCSVEKMILGFQQALAYVDQRTIR
jgi:glycosyltransferase involved in cell wall biosynthesis